MKLKIISILALSSGLFLGACDNSIMPSKKVIGAGAGGVAGGYACKDIGSGSGNTAAVIGCTMLGAVVGGWLGDSLDKADQVYAEQATEKAVATNQPVEFYNPDTQTRYTVRPKTTGYNNQGQECRYFTATVDKGGQEDSEEIKACRQPDGTWKTI